MKQPKPATKPKAQVHPIVEAWGEFKAANPGAFEPETLGTIAPSVYLENRLYNAFQAGWDAAEKQLGKALRRVK